MWKPNWRKAAWYAAAVAVLLAALSGSILANIAYEERQHAERADKAAREERQAISALLDNPREQSIATETGERRRSEREQSDLDAQWFTAGGTIAQAVFSLAGLLGLAATVFYARRAVEHTQTELEEARIEEGRQANRFKQQLELAQGQAADARSIGRKQVRAYLATADATVRWTAVSHEDDDKKCPTCWVVCDIKNAGASPAKAIRVSATCNWTRGASLGTSTQKMKMDPIAAGATEPVILAFLCPEVERTDDEESYAADHVKIIVSVRGNDVFGEPLDTVDSTYWYTWNIGGRDKDRKKEAKLTRRNAVYDKKKR